MLLFYLTSLSYQRTFASAGRSSNATVTRRMTFSLLLLWDFVLSTSPGWTLDDLDLLSTAVSRVISNAWDANARSITVTTRSKEWWNDEYRDAQEPERIGVCSAPLQDLQNGPSLTTGLQRLHPPTNAPGTL